MSPIGLPTATESPDRLDGASERWLWIAVPLAAIVALVVIDLAAGPKASVIGALVVAPLLASLRLSPRATAAVALLATVVAFGLGLPTNFFGESAHLTRILPVPLGGALGVWLARARIERMRRERRLTELLEREHAARLAAERAIAERKRAEARNKFLADAATVLSASLDYRDTLARVAHLALPELGDACVVDVLEEDGVRRVAIAHTDPAKERLLREIGRRYPSKPEHDWGSAAAIRTGEAQVHERVDDGLLRRVAVDDEHLGMLRELELGSGMSVPLTARGRVLGALTFAASSSGRRLDRDDLELAEELARRAAVAIENARLYGERSHIARTLQASLLPSRLPDIPGVEVVARYRAAGDAIDVGGDFYDVFALEERRFGAVIGDVLGKGATAAAMIGLARHTLRGAAMRGGDPVRILTTLNEALLREGDEDSFCTAVYVTIALEGDRVSLEVTSAGHPLPLLQRPDGSVEPAGEPGTLLGAVARIELRPRRLELAPGDSLVLFTDGVVEARSNEGTFGERRLKLLLRELAGRSGAEAADRIEREAVAFQPGGASDDLAVLVIRRTASAGEPPAAASPLEAVRADA